MREEERPKKRKVRVTRWALKNKKKNKKTKKSLLGCDKKGPGF
jgi:hypothetical protein